jgi:leucyl-tRNA synthetase
MTLDLHKIARRWQRQWKAQKIYESDPDSKPKFFLTTPYPYVNGFLHIGHTYTYMRVDALARYKRMQGFNVLFPFAWHCTGTPITSAAKLVQNNDAKQVEILKMQGFSDAEIPLFKEPIHWIKTFSKNAEQDLRDYGMSIDWRRAFITTDLNPRYDKFIKWQFNTLKKKGLVVKGEHPVVWNPVENVPVGDHDRSEGEGETPQEMLLIKFKAEDLVFPCATFRPETVFGATNIWVNPELKYIEANVDGEKWIITHECKTKLADQKHNVVEIKEILGKDLIGKEVVNPVTGHKVPILPGHFVSKDTGTGVVMSVPAHAPYDFAALKETGKDLKLTSLIKVEGYGEFPAKEIVEKMKINSSTDAKLDDATQEIYKKEFHTGTLKEICGKYKGKTIQQAKPEITKDLISEGKAATLLELVNPVISRSKIRCHVKIVDNQWFLTYSNQEWKDKTMKAISAMKFYPEKARAQFEHTVGWLNDWACAREHGLGTALPWDKNWKIESLSDSTIYNAFYTLVPHLKKIPLGKINDKLFDYVLLGQGNSDDIKIEKQTLDLMRKEFVYWYPVDFRNSGKDLIQNHLTFYIFNHTAIFPESQWPAGIGVNGYVTINKAKMSKSKGNFKTLRELIKTFSADIVRFTILANGEELNDTDWDTELADTMKSRLQQFYDFAISNYSEKTNENPRDIDRWMEHQINLSIKDCSKAMDETLFRTALLRGFFDLSRHFKWYQRRTAGKMNKETVNHYIITQLKLLTPFCPHFCEEIWHKIGNESFIVNENWPIADESKINIQLEHTEKLMSQMIDDVTSVLRLAKIEQPREITFFVASSWKAELCKKLKAQLENTRDIGLIMKTLIPEFKQYPGAAELIQKLAKDPSKMPLTIENQEAEYQNLADSSAFLKQEYNCLVHVIKEQDSQEQKAKQALPGKPAILVK